MSIRQKLLKTSSLRSAREARILLAIEDLKEGTPGQISEKVKVPRRTLFRDLTILIKKGLIEKKGWKRYVRTQQSNEEFWDLIDQLVVEADFFAEWSHMLQNAVLEAVDYKRRPSYDKWLTFPLDDVETIPGDMEALTKQIKAKLSESTVFRWKTRTTPRQQHLEKPPEIQKTPEAPRCAECGGTDFETKDERQYCVKCGLERTYR